jgi:Uma2 family endonuclease
MAVDTSATRTTTRPNVSRRHTKPVYYPESDGRPMAETDLHRDLMVDAIETLKDHFAADPHVYVSGNLLLYYEEGNPRRSVSPDVFVVRGVPAGRRRIYKLWDEGVAPQWVLEITSRKTRREDVHTKREVYAQLGVAEYFLFDPLTEYLRPPLQGNVLVNGEYVPLTPDADGSILSRQLGLTLVVRDSALRFVDPATGKMLPTRAEARDQAEAARREAEAAWQAQAKRAEAEAARAAAAEAEIARLRALLAQRADHGGG